MYNEFLKYYEKILLSENMTIKPFTIFMRNKCKFSGYNIGSFNFNIKFKFVCNNCKRIYNTISDNLLKDQLDQLVGKCVCCKKLLCNSCNFNYQSKECFDCFKNQYFSILSNTSIYLPPEMIVKITSYIDFENKFEAFNKKYYELFVKCIENTPLYILDQLDYLLYNKVIHFSFIYDINYPPKYFQINNLKFLNDIMKYEFGLINKLNIKIKYSNYTFNEEQLKIIIEKKIKNFIRILIKKKQDIEDVNNQLIKEKNENKKKKINKKNNRIKRDKKTEQKIKLREEKKYLKTKIKRR